TVGRQSLRDWTDAACYADLSLATTAPRRRLHSAGTQRHGMARKAVHYVSSKSYGGSSCVACLRYAPIGPWTCNSHCCRDPLHFVSWEANTATVGASDGTRMATR